MKKIIFILCILTTQFIYAKSILFLGDSLTEGLGVSKTEAYPHLVEELVKKRLNKNIDAINGGVSGSTISDGLSRLKWYLRTKPDIVFVALGANDGLRGLNLQESQRNLEKIIDEALKSGAKVLLAGMLLPPNYGKEYSEDFKNMFIKLKDKYKLKFMPFLLKDVAGVQELNQADGIHPTSEGYKIIANEVFEFLKDEL
ncbi:arylesterase [Halarcobacter sp.]|uniref:arylesterase n=1 Tax=Halarcobacter sp. TaxID=2321133 RepID=UPI0029F57E54|nr:arylesterase [Halarcobacter sp.]